MRAALVMIVVAGAGLAVAPAFAQPKGEPDCSQWTEKKGFSTDYIKLETGKRQRGAAESWRGNVAPRDVQPGDVVITPMKDKGRRMRVSYVEDVRRDGQGNAGAVVVTEWNEGKYIDEPCLVTDHFGRDSGQRSVPLDTVVRVWRPSLPLAGPPPE
jgi:hypothetical protein